MLLICVRVFFLFDSFFIPHGPRRVGLALLYDCYLSSLSLYVSISPSLMCFPQIITVPFSAKANYHHTTKPNREKRKPLINSNLPPSHGWAANNPRNALLFSPGCPCYVHPFSFLFGERTAHKNAPVSVCCFMPPCNQCTPQAPPNTTSSPPQQYTQLRRLVADKKPDNNTTTTNISKQSTYLHSYIRCAHDATRWAQQP